MSREQWGHGYWKGVKDAKEGKVIQKDEIEKLSKVFVCVMCNFNRTKACDKTLFSVRELYIFATTIVGLSEELIHEVYNYILHYTPYGCYVSGDLNDDWMKDYFVLPNLTKEECDNFITQFDAEVL